MIRFNDVNKWFGSLHVLRDVSLNIAPSEVAVVCGPSGSGKSTLIRCVNRLETIQSGEIFVDGLAVHDRSADLIRLRTEIGFVFQQDGRRPAGRPS